MKGSSKSLGRASARLVAVLVLLAFAAVLVPASSALAQVTPTTPGVTTTGVTTAGTPLFGNQGLGRLGVAIGLGLIVIGAARGIGAIGSHAVDAIARQPEAGQRIFTSMIISAALIEGATLFAVVVALLAIPGANVL